MVFVCSSAEAAGTTSPACCDQFAIRPSEFVAAWNVVVGEESGVRVTAIEAPGRPVVVSRTWQVMGARGIGDAMFADGLLVVRWEVTD